MSRAVDVGIVTVRGLILDVRGRDGQDFRGVAASLRFRGLGHFIVRNELGESGGRHHAGERSRQSRLAVVNMSDRSDIDMRLGTGKLFL